MYLQQRPSTMRIQAQSAELHHGLHAGKVPSSGGACLLGAACRRGQLLAVRQLCVGMRVALGSWGRIPLQGLAQGR